MPRPNSPAIRRERHPFRPDYLPGLRVWVAAHWIDGLADNDPITTAPDLSGLGNDFAQATAGDKPLYKTNIVNGYPVIRLDGSSDYLESPFSINDEVGELLAWVAVFRTNTTTGQQLILWQGDSNANGFGGETEIHMGIGDVNEAGNLVDAAMGRLSPSVGSNISFSDTTNFHVLAAQFTGLQGSAPTCQVFLDGAPGPIRSGAAENPGNWISQTRMGRPGVATRFFNGDLAEVAIYNPAAWGDTTLVNHAKLAAYARAKYALL
jgi:hypothetical protein